MSDDWALDTVSAPPRIGALALALREAQIRIADLTEISLQGVLAHRRFRPVFANHQLCAILGYASSAELLARVSVLEHFDPELQSDPDRTWRRLTAPGDTLTRLTLRRRDGSAFPADVLSRAVPWDGEITVLMCILDVSRQERAILALAEARAEVDRADRARRRFLAAASHDLRTPLHAAMGRLQLLIDAAEGASSQLATEALGACRRLQQHIDDVLDDAALETGGSSLQAESFCLAQILREALDLFAEDNARPGLPVELDVDPDAHIRGDPRRVRRIALAILEEGAIRHPNTPLALHAAIEQSGVTLRGSATGATTTTEARSRTVSQSVDGLLLAQRLTQAMGGVFAMRGGIGATWEAEAFLPLPSVRKRIQRTLPMQSLDIMVVEDNAGNRALLDLVLRNLGHRPQLASGGREALALAARRRFDAVIMDLAMPELDGFETARLLRTGPVGWANAAPIIALTASAAPGVEEVAADVGMDAFLSKPLDIRRLAETLALLCRAPTDLVGASELDEVEREDYADEAENERQRHHANAS